MSTNELRELLAKATPGPWRGGNAVTMDPLNFAECWGSRAEANAALIAAAVNALPALLDRLDSLAGELDFTRNLAGRLHESHQAMIARAEAAEAELAQMREALEEIATYRVGDGRPRLGFDYDDAKERAEKALAAKPQGVG